MSRLGSVDVVLRYYVFEPLPIIYLNLQEAAKGRYPLAFGIDVGHVDLHLARH